MSIWRGVSVNKAQSDQFSAQKISQFFAPEAKLQQWIEYSWHFEDMSIFLSLLAKFFGCNSISDHQISSARWCWNVLPKWYGKKIYYLICNLYVPFNSQKSYFNFHLFHVWVHTYLLWFLEQTSRQKLSSNGAHWFDISIHSIFSIN